MTCGTESPKSMSLGDIEGGNNYTLLLVCVGNPCSEGQTTDKG